MVNNLNGSPKEAQRTNRRTRNRRDEPFLPEDLGQAGADFGQPDDASADSSPPPQLVYAARISTEGTESVPEAEDQVMDCEDAAEEPPSSQSSDTIAEEADQGKGTAKSTGEVYVEILDVLRRLRLDLADALDREARMIIEEVEREASHLLGTRIREEVGRKDHDGDIEMGGGGGGEGRERTVPAYYPASPVSETSEVSPYVSKAPTELRFEEIEDRMQRMEGDVRELQWKAAGEEYRQGDFVLFESRLAALEVQKAEEADGWKIAQPNRRKPRAPATRGNRNRGGVTGGKLDAINEEIFGVRMRMGDIEQVLKGVESWKGQITAMNLKMDGSIADAVLWMKKVGEVEAKCDELRLRQDVLTRDIGQGKAAVNLGISPRISRIEASVTKVENRMKGAEFRLGTYEEQASWTDQKIRGIFHLAIQESAPERFIFASTVRTVWETAAKAYEDRMRHAPLVSDESSEDP